MSALATMATTRVATVFTHRRPTETNHVLGELVAAAERHGVVLRFCEEETEKHGLQPSPTVQVNAPVANGVDLCVVLGGDGTILAALRRYAGTSVPVFAVNFGELGFLATIGPDEVDVGFARAFRGDFETLLLPAIALSNPYAGCKAINDISLHRKPGARVAQLAYSVGGQEIGCVRCDGLVVSTPAGSTGYNLANGGPVLAWGVEGYVVSFIAPHSLTARALVVAPTDTMEISNKSAEDAVDLTADGRPLGELGPQQSVEVHFEDHQSHLAHIPGTTFYHRLREKFGRLSS